MPGVIAILLLLLAELGRAELPVSFGDSRLKKAVEHDSHAGRIL